MTSRSNDTVAVIDAKGDTRRMLAVLDQWVERGWLRALDAGFARFLWTEEPRTPPLLVLAAALASHQLGRGHVCLDLQATLDDPTFALSLPPDGPQALTTTEPPQAPAEVLAGVNLARWLAALDQPALVGAARRIRNGRAGRNGFATPSSASVCSKASSLTTVVVLPVPGPPVMMLNALRAASAQASFCQSALVASVERAGNRTSNAVRAEPACSDASICADAASRRSIPARTSCSYCQ